MYSHLQTIYVTAFAKPICSLAKTLLHSLISMHLISAGNAARSALSGTFALPMHEIIMPHTVFLAHRVRVLINYCVNWQMNWYTFYTG